MRILEPSDEATAKVIKDVSHEVIERSTRHHLDDSQCQKMFFHLLRMRGVNMKNRKDLALSILKQTWDEVYPDPVGQGEKS